MSEADVLARDGGVLGLDQPVVARAPGAALGLPSRGNGAAAFEQVRDDAVEKRRAVVGVEAADAEGKLARHRLQHRKRATLADERSCVDNLPLRDLVDGVDMVAALGLRGVALVYWTRVLVGNVERSML